MKSLNELQKTIDTCLNPRCLQISMIIIDQNRRDRFSHVLHHSTDRKYLHDWTKHFEILGSNYNSMTNRKISESSFTREYNPTMNTPGTSYSLKLSN